MANHIYKIKLLPGQEQSDCEEASPVIRVVSEQPMAHNMLMPCESATAQHVHLWMSVGKPYPVLPAGEPEHASLVLHFGDAQAQHMTAMQNLAYALQCDGVHSVWASADLPDLADLFAPDSPWVGRQTHSMSVGSAIADIQPETMGALQAAWQEVHSSNATGMLVLRAHPPRAVALTTLELRQWHSNLPVKLRMLCWDVYDPTLQAGQCRYTLLLNARYGRRHCR